MSYLFKSKIKCKQCQQNLRGKLERSKKVYICSSYSKLSASCIRYRVLETDIIDMVTGHLKLRGVVLEGDLASYVDRVDVTLKDIGVI